MDPLSFLKSIVKFEQPAHSEPLKLKQGQIINGKIIRFLPNQMAVIQIGSQKLMAQLETSLAANQQYWFKVQSEAGKIHLKLVKESIKQITQESSESVRVQNNSPDGLIEQVYTQVPIQLGQENVEISIQWNGRKNEDGKIDPNNCRILFFVELKNIGEIFVDLQFQNRKIQMVILNGTQNLDLIAQSEFARLKENLQKLNFQLASLKIDPPPSEKSLKALLRKPSTNDKIVDQYQGLGVDVRV